MQRPNRPARVAVIGIGSELHGDDAAGILIVRELTGQENLLAIDAGTAPENHTGALRRFQPDLILLIDTARMNLAAGAIRILDPDSADAAAPGTHAPSLALLTQYLQAEFGCSVLLLGIQPATTDLHAEISPGVQKTIKAVREFVQAMLGSTEPATSRESQSGG